MLLYKKTGHSGYSLADVSRFFYDYFFLPCAISLKTASGVSLPAFPSDNNNRS